MAAELLVSIENGRAVGRTPHDAEVLAELEGGEYRAVLTTPRGRSVPQNNLFHAFCSFIAANYPGDVDKNSIKSVLKIECGHCHVLKLADGTYVRAAKSIAFNEMSSDAFTEFMNRAFDVAAIKFGPELATAALVKMTELSSAASDARAPNKARAMVAA